MQIVKKSLSKWSFSHGVNQHTIITVFTLEKICLFPLSVSEFLKNYA